MRRPRRGTQRWRDRIREWDVCMRLSSQLERILTTCWTEAETVSTWMPEEMWSGRVWWEEKKKEHYFNPVVAILVDVCYVADPISSWLISAVMFIWLRFSWQRKRQQINILLKLVTRLTDCNLKEEAPFRRWPTGLNPPEQQTNNKEQVSNISSWTVAHSNDLRSLTDTGENHKWSIFVSVYGVHA